MKKTKPRKTRARYDDSDVETYRAALKKGAGETTPEGKKYDAEELFEQLRADIADKRRENFSVNQICQFLIDGGMEHAPSTIRRHIGAVTPRRSKRRGTTEAKRTGQTTKRQQPTRQPASVDTADSGQSTKLRARSSAIVDVIPDDENSS